MNLKQLTYNMSSVEHLDMGINGSEFVCRHRPVKNRFLFTILLAILLTLAFSFGLHLMDKHVLTSICLVLIVSLVIKLYVKVYSESVLVLPSLGIQVKTCFFLGRVNTNFIHMSHIKDIVINEAITMHSVIYYLVVLMKGQTSQDLEKLYPLFSHSWPGLQELIKVYRTTQEKLILNHPSELKNQTSELQQSML